MAIITHEPAPAPFTPDPNESRPNTSNRKRWLAAGAGGLALGALLYLGTKSTETTYTVENNLSPDKGTEAPVVPGEVQESPVDPEFAYAIETLASMRQESAAELRAQGMTIDLPEVASDDNTSEELLGKYQSDLHSILKIGMTNPDEARRLLVGVISPDNIDDFNGISNDLIGKYGAEFIPTYGFKGVEDWSDNFYTSMIDGVSANGGAMRYISASTIPNADIWHQITFRRDDGEWIIHKMVTADDPSFVTDTIAFNQSIPQQAS